MTPIDRACLQYAYQVVLGVDHAYVSPTGACLLLNHAEELDPASNPISAAIAAFTAMIKLHLGGIGFGELRNDLIQSGVGEEFANRVHDHLADVSVSEWAGLRDRIRWYGDDTGEPPRASTGVSGGD